MKQTVSKYDFERAFTEHGRGDQFSYEALDLLFYFLESYEEDTEQEIELDVIAICCEFAEDTWESIADNYSIDTSDCTTSEAIEEVEDYLRDNTMLVGVTEAGTFVYQEF